MLKVFQEEMGVVKSYNLKPGGDKIPVTKQNRKGESTLRVTAVSMHLDSDESEVICSRNVLTGTQISSMPA